MSNSLGIGAVAFTNVEVGLHGDSKRNELIEQVDDLSVSRPERNINTRPRCEGLLSPRGNKS